MPQLLTAEEAPNGADEAWRQILARAAARQGASDLSGPLADLFGPVLDGAAAGAYVVAHLGQSLDGRIALPDGQFHHVTSPDDATHNHRLRALCDAVIVGAWTAELDDPQLTVRMVEGDNPVRVIVDPRRRLNPGLGVFSDGAAPTLLICTADAAAGAVHHGDAEIVSLPALDGARLSPRSITGALAARGLTSLFVEGGGVTVSHFIEAGLLDRLHIAVAPTLLGDGTPVVTLPGIERIDEARRLSVRPFELGDELLYDCVFDDGS